MSRLARSVRLSLTALLLAGCASHPPADSARADAERTATAGEPAGSVYELTSGWRDQRDVRRSLASLRGGPRVVAMIYTHCTATCPLALGEMKRIAAATDSSVGLVLVSLDPARDTPGALASYARDHGLDGSRWTLLSGSDGDVRELAAVLDVRFRRLGVDAIAHSNVITLLDATGVIAHRQVGFEGTPEAIRLARSLSQRSSRS